MITDPSLPGLAQVLDPERAARWYGEDFVERAARRDTKYTPGARCIVAHELSVAGERVFVTAEATPAGATWWLATDDPELPALGQLLDDELVSERLGQHCVTRLMRYKPLTRAVVRVETSGRSLIAKCLATGQPPAPPDLPQLAPSLAWWADWSTLIQPVIEGRELHSLLVGDATARDRALEAAGRCAATLHAAPVTMVDAPSRTFADDLSELDGYLPPIAQADPGLAGRYGTLVEGLYGRGSGSPLAPGHGALRTDAFILPQPAGAPVLIDLDGLCRSEPARDVANLLAYLDWRAIRRSGDADGLAAAANAFLKGYQRVRPLPEARRLAVYRAGSLLKIAGRRYRSLADKEWRLVPALLDRARTTSDTLNASAR